MCGVARSGDDVLRLGLGGGVFGCCGYAELRRRDGGGHGLVVVGEGGGAGEGDKGGDGERYLLEEMMGFLGKR